MAMPIVAPSTAPVQNRPFRTTLHTFSDTESRTLLLLGLTVQQAHAGKQVLELAIGDCLNVVITREGRNEYALWAVNKPRGEMSSDSLHRVAFGGVITYLIDAATDRNDLWVRLVGISKLCGVPVK